MAYRKTELISAGIEGRKALIIGACIDLLSKGGWEAMTTNAIAQRAGVAAGLIYKPNYYPDKRELEAAVTAHVLARDLALIRDAGDLAAGIRTWAKQCASAPRVAATIGATPEYRNGIKTELTRQLRAAGVENSPLMGAMVYGAVLEACWTLRPRDELLMISKLQLLVGLRVRA